MPRKLLVAGAAQTLVCVACLTYFCLAFDITIKLLAVHVPLVVALLLVTVAGARFLRRRLPFGDGVSSYVAACLPATGFTLLLALYAANAGNNHFMHVNLTHPVLRMLIADVLRGGNMLQVTSAAAAAAAAVVAIVFLAHVSMWGYALQGKTPDLATPLPRRSAKIAAVAMVLGYAVFFQQLSWRTPHSELLSADPVLAFIRTSVTVEDPYQRLVTARLQVQEPTCRAAYPRNRPFERKNIIIIMVDSLRADHMQIYGYERPTTPFLAELLAAGKLKKVDFATSICAESNCGILGTLYSKTLRHQIPESFKIYDLLRDQGYETNVLMSGDQSYMGLYDLFSRDPMLLLDGRASGPATPADDRVLLQLLDRVPSGNAPSFFYFHLMSAHQVGKKLPEFQIYQPAEGPMDWRALVMGRYDRTRVTNAYDNGVVQADAMLKELLAALEQRGFLQNSVAVILSDHGEGLGDRGPTDYSHVTSLYQGLIGIPMLIYDDSPFVYGNLEAATQLDVAPTLIDRIGLPAPDCWEGRSLVEPRSPRVTEHQTMLNTPCYALIDDSTGQRFKYMACALGRREELYNLSADPRERTNLIGSVPPERLAWFRDRLEQWRRQ